MVKKRIGFGFFLLLFSILGYFGTYSIHERIKMEVSAVFFPRVILATLGILSVALIIKGYREYREESFQKVENKERPHYMLLFLSLTTCISYGIFIKYLGFIVTSILFLLIQIWIMTNNMTLKKFIRNTCISVPLVLVLYFLFTTVFFVPLP